MVRTNSPGLAFGQRLAGLGVDDLQDVVVFPEVQAGFVLALEGDAGAVHLGQAVGVIDIAAEGLLDSAPGLLGVRFRADERLAQREVFARVDALLFEVAGKVEGVAGQDMDGGGPEVLHQHQLPLGSARARRE